MSTTEMKAVPAGGSPWRAILARGAGPHLRAAFREKARGRFDASRSLKGELHWRDQAPGTSLARPSRPTATLISHNRGVVMSSTQVRTNATDGSKRYPHLGAKLEVVVIP